MALPLAALILTPGFFRRPFSRVWKPLSLWFLLAVPIVAVTKANQPDFTITELVGFPQRLLVAADALLVSLSHFFFPLHLSINYGRTPSVVLQRFATPSLVALLIVILASIWLSRNRILGRDLRVAGALFIAFWLPTSGLVPFFYQNYSTVADRFLYLSMLGPALFVSASLMRAPNAVSTALLIVALVFSSVKSGAQLHYWSGPLPLVAHMTEVNPSAKSHYSLGTLLAATASEISPSPITVRPFD